MIEQVVVPIWVSIKPETRDKIREIFRIGRSSHAEVITDSMGHSTVMCDGTTNVDLQNLTVEKMRDFLGTVAFDETVHDLFKRVVEQLENPQTIETSTPICNASKPCIDSIKSTVESIPVTNLNKCPDCEYTHASKQGLRMHIMKRHLKK